MKNKISIVLVSIMLLSASCNLFGNKGIAGVVKTVNGGVDWQFTNRIKDNDKASLDGVPVSAMSFDPNRRETIYISSDVEGLYRSEDSGVTWSKVLSKIAVYDFVVHPSQPKKIYVAGSFGGNGKVLVTKDGGATWDEIYNEESPTNPVRAIALNPVSPNQLVIGTNAGNIILSTDEGVNWKLLKNFASRINDVQWRNGSLYVLLETKGLHIAPENGEFADTTTTLSGGSVYIDQTRAGAFHQLLIAPQDPDVIFIATDRGLQKSLDGGKTWQNIALPIKPEAANVRAVAVAPGSNNIIYASVGSTVYKSTDGGQSFQTQKIITTGYVNYILVDPALPQISYAGIYVK
jgi:photosystem II stability/assembly factor-like uncharacterized protein